MLVSGHGAGGASTTRAAPVSVHSPLPLSLPDMRYTTENRGAHPPARSLIIYSAFDGIISSRGGGFVFEETLLIPARITLLSRLEI